MCVHVCMHMIWAIVVLAFCSGVFERCYDMHCSFDFRISCLDAVIAWFWWFTSHLKKSTSQPVMVIIILITHVAKTAGMLMNCSFGRSTPNHVNNDNGKTMLFPIHQNIII